MRGAGLRKPSASARSALTSRASVCRMKSSTTAAFSARNAEQLAYTRVPPGLSMFFIESMNAAVSREITHGHTVPYGSGTAGDRSGCGVVVIAGRLHLSVRTVGRLKTPQDFNDLVVATRGNSTIPICSPMSNARPCAPRSTRIRPISRRKASQARAPR